MDKDTAVNELRSGHICYKDFSGKIVDIKRDIANGIADFIEQQEKYAELGRLAVSLDECFCPCKYGSEECGIYDCSDSLQVFCQKRAELRKLEGVDRDG